jgi:hypothetical protein
MRGRFARGHIEEPFRSSPNLRISNPRVAADVVYEAVYSLTHENILYCTNEISLEEFINETADMLCRYIFEGEDSGAVKDKRPSECAQG